MPTALTSPESGLDADTTMEGAPMSSEIKRLHLAKLSPPGGERGQWPVHGFVIAHPGGAVLVDTGVGGPQDLLSDWRVVNVSAAGALGQVPGLPRDLRQPLRADVAQHRS